MLLFVGGFTVVFVALFGFTDVFVQVLRGTVGRVVTGAVIAGFGGLLVLYAFGKHSEVPRGYAALIQEQRRLWRQQEEARRFWKK